MYTAGEFAKKAGVTIRTIRYYDTKGILKPSDYSKSGYRLYKEEDFGKLQKILALKELGFSLQEIKEKVNKSKDEKLSSSLSIQKEAFEKKIEHMKVIIEAISNAEKMIEESSEVQWEKIIDIINLLNIEKKVEYQFRNPINLVNMINIHEKYGVNKEDWHEWIYRKMDLKDSSSILELGCGNGELWVRNKEAINKSHNIILTDKSKGMVEECKSRLNDVTNMSFKEMDMCNIQYENETFDVVIANHVLGYVEDVEKVLKEIKRVLKRGGYFYCSTIGKNHMIELGNLVKEFEKDIVLSEIKFSHNFGLENGQGLLERHFKEIERYIYDDYLIVIDPADLINYLYSSYSHSKDSLIGRYEEFESYVLNKFNENQGGFIINKDNGIFCSVK